MTRAIFHPDDDGLLNYMVEDGVGIEPEYYLPTVPLVLINGADGIGTGRLASRLIVRSLKLNRMEYFHTELQSRRHCRQPQAADAW